MQSLFVGTLPVAGSPWRRRLSMSQDALLVVLSALFFYVNAQRVVVDGVLTSLPFAIEQALLVGMFLMRRRSIATSSRPVDWIVAAGGWLPILMRPSVGFSVGTDAAGTLLQTTGLMMTFVGFIFLGRSFGVVAANRGLKVGGPYRLVRHPIYLSHTITVLGFMIANPTPVNAALLVAVIICLILRIRAEERVLTETADYAAYKARVPWRLLPGLY